MEEEKSLPIQDKATTSSEANNSQGDKLSNTADKDENQTQSSEKPKRKRNPPRSKKGTSEEKALPDSASKPGDSKKAPPKKVTKAATTTKAKTTRSRKKKSDDDTNSTDPPKKSGNDTTSTDPPKKSGDDTTSTDPPKKKNSGDTNRTDPSKKKNGGDTNSSDPPEKKKGKKNATVSNNLKKLIDDSTVINESSFDSTQTVTDSTAKDNVPEQEKDTVQKGSKRGRKAKKGGSLFNYFSTEPLGKEVDDSIKQLLRDEGKDSNGEPYDPQTTNSQKDELSEEDNIEDEERPLSSVKKQRAKPQPKAKAKATKPLKEKNTTPRKYKVRASKYKKDKNQPRCFESINPEHMDLDDLDREELEERAQLIKDNWLTNPISLNQLQLVKDRQEIVNLINASSGIENFQDQDHVHIPSVLTSNKLIKDQPIISNSGLNLLSLDHHPTLPYLILGGSYQSEVTTVKINNQPQLGPTQLQLWNHDQLSHVFVHDNFGSVLKVQWLPYTIKKPENDKDMYEDDWLGLVGMVTSDGYFRLIRIPKSPDWYQINEYLIVMQMEWFSHNKLMPVNFAFSPAWTPGKLAVGTVQGSIIGLDLLASQQSVPRFINQSHHGLINQVYFATTNDELVVVSAGMDGRLLFFTWASPYLSHRMYSMTQPITAIQPHSFPEQGIYLLDSSHQLRWAKLSNHIDSSISRLFQLGSMPPFAIAASPHHKLMAISHISGGLSIGLPSEKARTHPHGLLLNWVTNPLQPSQWDLNLPETLPNAPVISNRTRTYADWDTDRFNSNRALRLMQWNPIDPFQLITSTCTGIIIQAKVSPS